MSGNMTKRNDMRKPKVSSEALWLWGTLKDWEESGLLDPRDVRSLCMPLHMAADIYRIAPRLRKRLEDMSG